MLRVMSRRGDDRVTWDEQKVLAGDPEAAAAVREAERIFTQERAKGATAFRVEPGKPAERIEQFDRTAEQIIRVPRVVGGGATSLRCSLPWVGLWLSSPSPPCCGWLYNHT